MELASAPEGGAPARSGGFAEYIIKDQGAQPYLRGCAADRAKAPAYGKRYPDLKASFQIRVSFSVWYGYCVWVFYDVLGSLK